MNDFYYRKLDAYHKAKQLVVDIYSVTKTFPQHEQFVLSNQLQRAAISIPSNIAEGMGRFSLKERIHFFDIAYGSLMETMAQIEIAHDLQYISTEQLHILEENTSIISKMLVGLRNALERKLQNSQGSSSYKQ